MIRGGKIATVLLAATAATVLLATAVRAGSGAREVVVVVQGMACPFCVYGLEKNLGDLNGVTHVEVDLGKSQVTLKIEEGSSPSDEEIRRAVREAGFTTAEIRWTGVTKQGRKGRDGKQ